MRGFLLTLKKLKNMLKYYFLESENKAILIIENQENGTFERAECTTMETLDSGAQEINVEQFNEAIETLKGGAHPVRPPQ